MVTISCAFRYNVSARSTGTLISTAAPAWSMPETRSVSRGSAGFGTIRGAGAGGLVNGFMAAQYDIPGQPDISIETDLSRLLERLRAKWIPVRVKKTRQNQNLEPRSDSIGTEKALGSCWSRV